MYKNFKRFEFIVRVNVLLLDRENHAYQVSVDETGGEVFF